MSSMYDKLEGLAQAAGTQAGPATDGDALVGRVRRTRSAFRFGSAGVVGVAGLGILFGGVAFANGATQGLADKVTPGASTSASTTTSLTGSPSASPTVEPSEAAEPTESVTPPDGVAPSPMPTWSSGPGGPKGDDGNETPDKAGSDDHNATGGDGHDAPDDSHHTTGGSTNPNPAPSVTTGGQHRD
jgi:hypothetical protein